MIRGAHPAAPEVCDWRLSGSDALCVCVLPPSVCVLCACAWRAVGQFSCCFVRCVSSQEWEADEADETDEWHEDTYEWKEKKKENFKFDPKDPTASLNSYAPSGMQMVFCKLKKAHWGKTKKESEELAARWSALMKTNALDAKAYAIDEKQLLFTEDNGRIFELKNFVLAQPETYKFTWNSQDYYPADVEPKSEDDDAPVKKKKRKLPKKLKKKAKKLKKKNKGKKKAAASAEL